MSSFEVPPERLGAWLARWAQEHDAIRTETRPGRVTFTGADGATLVAFNGVPAPVLSDSATEIDVTVPLTVSIDTALSAASVSGVIFPSPFWSRAICGAFSMSISASIQPRPLPSSSATTTTAMPPCAGLTIARSSARSKPFPGYKAPASPIHSPCRATAPGDTRF